MDQAESAAHVFAGRGSKIGEDPTAVISAEIGPGISAPIGPTVPGMLPASPERRQPVNANIARDLEVLPAEKLSICERGRERPGDIIGALPVEAYGTTTVTHGAFAGTGARATGNSDEDHRSGEE